ncbi:MAG: TlyA family RNA methyltransferase [Candidatus Saganbacteria bacterium]|nr:TlyA family RNA methyltransferase [Candidatus Saganbacteria bacterium]
MKKRLDQILVEKELFESRNKAAAAILAGVVYVNGQKSDKAGKLLAEDVAIEVRGEPHPYVGRGGVKLEHALKEFKVDVKDKVALDIGASTGGFTDCLLQNGAAKVYAVDVGYGQLAWKLRQDSRVVVIERTNARYLTPDDLYKATQRPSDTATQKAEIGVIDVSFISLSKILPAVYDLLADKARVVALVKPQFEAKREQVKKGGIVKDKKVHQEVLEKVKKEAETIGFKVKDVTSSPITGRDGNIEFLLYLSKG